MAERAVVRAAAKAAADLTVEVECLAGAVAWEVGWAAASGSVVVATSEAASERVPWAEAAPTHTRQRRRGGN